MSDPLVIGQHHSIERDEDGWWLYNYDIKENGSVVPDPWGTCVHIPDDEMRRLVEIVKDML